MNTTLFTPRSRHHSATLAQSLARFYFEQELGISPESPEILYLRVAALLFELKAYFRTEQSEQRHALLERIDELITLGTESNLDQSFLDYLLETRLQLTVATPLSNLHASEWHHINLTASTRNIPGMNSSETMKFYKWLGSRLQGVGCVLDLGTWLGASASCLAEGLLANCRQINRTIYAVDTFVWREWMGQHHTNSRRLYSVGESFLDDFHANMTPFHNLVVPIVAYIPPLDQMWEPHSPAALGTIPELRWHGEPIELLIYDLGPVYERLVNTWQLFEPSFVSKKTIIVFNEYGKARAEAIRRFCIERQKQIVPLFKPRASGKAFLYTGRCN